ncbi:MAG: hypothetical protein HQK83_16055 [Fibrobacteria bacterium]|nr:hypothetical protein [Fibrobacteria bacterium]
MMKKLIFAVIFSLFTQIGFSQGALRKSSAENEGICLIEVYSAYYPTGVLLPDSIMEQFGIDTIWAEGNCDTVKFYVMSPLNTPLEVSQIAKEDSCNVSFKPASMLADVVNDTVINSCEISTLKKQTRAQFDFTAGGYINGGNIALEIRFSGLQSVYTSMTVLNAKGIKLYATRTDIEPGLNTFLFKGENTFVNGLCYVKIDIQDKTITIPVVLQ